MLPSAIPQTDEQRLTRDCAFVAGRYSSCPHCLKRIHKHSLARHIKNVHASITMLLECELCDSLLKNIDSLKKHMRDQHGIFKTR
jgi:hypothetical protein